MDPEEKKMLGEALELARDNNKMLHRIRRVQKWGAFWSGFKIILVIGIAFGSFYFLEPLLNKLTDAYGSIPTVGQYFKNFSKD